MREPPRPVIWIALSFTASRTSLLAAGAWFSPLVSLRANVLQVLDWRSVSRGCGPEGSKGALPICLHQFVHEPHRLWILQLPVRTRKQTRSAAMACWSAGEVCCGVRQQSGGGGQVHCTSPTSSGFRKHRHWNRGVLFLFLFLILVCEAIGTAATPGLLWCQPQVIVKMIVEKQMECILCRGNRRSRRKPVPAPLLPITKSHMTRPGLEPGPPRWGSRRLTAWAMARPNRGVWSSRIAIVFHSGGRRFKFRQDTDYPDILFLDSRRMRWAGHVARMGATKNAYRILVERPEGKIPLGRPRRRWVCIIKMDLREIDGMVWTGSILLRICTSGVLLWIW
jgi:hypothetical protein